MATIIRERLDQTIDAGIGAIRRFGTNGPVYEVIGGAAPDLTGRSQVRIRVIESGEELDYPADDMRADPGE